MQYNQRYCVSGAESSWYITDVKSQTQNNPVKCCYIRPQKNLETCGLFWNLSLSLSLSIYIYIYIYVCVCVCVCVCLQIKHQIASSGLELVPNSRKQSSEKPSSCSSNQGIPQIYETWRLLIRSCCAPCWDRRIKYALAHFHTHFLITSNLTLSAKLGLGIPSGLLPSAFQTEILCYASLISSTHTIYPSYTTRYLFTLTIVGADPHGRAV